MAWNFLALLGLAWLGTALLRMGRPAEVQLSEAMPSQAEQAKPGHAPKKSGEWIPSPRDATSGNLRLHLTVNKARTCTGAGGADGSELGNPSTCCGLPGLEYTG